MPIYEPPLTGVENFQTKFVATAVKTVTNSTTETSLFPVGSGTRSVPANWFMPGRAYRISLTGTISTPTILTGTATFRVRLGNTVIASASAGALIGGMNNSGFEMVGRIQATAIGTTGQVNLTGRATYPSGLLGGKTNADLNAKGVVVDTTVEQGIDVTIQWGTASSGSTIDVTVAIVEALVQ